MLVALLSPDFVDAEHDRFSEGRRSLRCAHEGSQSLSPRTSTLGGGGGCEAAGSIPADILVVSSSAGPPPRHVLFFLASRPYHNFLHPQCGRSRHVTGFVSIFMKCVLFISTGRGTPISFVVARPVLLSVSFLSPRKPQAQL